MVDFDNICFRDLPFLHESDDAPIAVAPIAVAPIAVPPTTHDLAGSSGVESLYKTGFDDSCVFCGLQVKYPVNPNRNYTTWGTGKQQIRENMVPVNDNVVLESGRLRCHLSCCVVSLAFFEGPDSTLWQEFQPAANSPSSSSSGQIGHGVIFPYILCHECESAAITPHNVFRQCLHCVRTKVPAVAASLTAPKIHMLVTAKSSGNLPVSVVCDGIEYRRADLEQRACHRVQLASKHSRAPVEIHLYDLHFRGDSFPYRENVASAIRAARAIRTEAIRPLLTQHLIPDLAQLVLS